MEVNTAYKENLESCEKKIINIYHSYLTEITPLIILLETIDSEYPAEIMNEIRAIFTHLARYYEFISENVAVVSNNLVTEKLEAQIGLAERHLKRCKLDCYKYACLSFSDKLLRFDSEYKAVDLTYVERGEFINKLNSLRYEAFNKYQDAKKIDTTGFKYVGDIDDYDLAIKSEDYQKYVQFICDDDLYNAYEEAYLKYYECDQLVEKHRKDIDFLKKKATRKDILAVGGFAVGILGIIVSILLSIFL